MGRAAGVATGNAHPFGTPRKIGMTQSPPVKTKTLPLSFSAAASLSKVLQQGQIKTGGSSLPHTCH